MTAVHALLHRPDGDGTPAPAKGYLRWRAVRDWDTAFGAITLPLPFRVKLVNGAATVTVDATGEDWVWEVTYQLSGLPHETRYYRVPESASVVELTALVEVDGKSTSPSQPAPALWYAALAELAARVEGLVVNGVPGLPGADGADGEDGAPGTPGAPGAPGQSVGTVAVTTGAEPRPVTSAPVWWVGGTVQPAAMVDGDLWFKAAG